MSDEQVISDRSDLKRYRTELPNLYDDSNLNVYEFRLLAHYKRVGECTESVETTAKKCKMSTGQVSETRAALAELKFISLERVPMGGERYRYIVTVRDRWIENFAKYSGLSIHEIAAQLQKGSPSRGEGSPSQSPSRGEGKKELKKDLVIVVGDADFANVSKLYTTEIGALTPLIADAIRDACKTYPVDWIPEAMEIAVKKNARSWHYIEAILKNCKSAGKRPSLNKLENKNGTTRTGNSHSTKPTGQAKADTPQYSDADRAAADRVKAKQRKPAKVS